MMYLSEITLAAKMNAQLVFTCTPSVDHGRHARISKRVLKWFEED